MDLSFLKPFPRKGMETSSHLMFSYPCWESFLKPFPRKGMETGRLQTGTLEIFCFRKPFPRKGMETR